MKRTFLSLALITANILTPLSANPSPSYTANQETSKQSPIGHGVSNGSHAATTASMMGWGLGITALIAVVAIIAHNTASDHVHAHSGNTTTK